MAEEVNRAWSGIPSKPIKAVWNHKGSINPLTFSESCWRGQSTWLSPKYWSIQMEESSLLFVSLKVQKACLPSCMCLCCEGEHDPTLDLQKVWSTFQKDRVSHSSFCPLAWVKDLTRTPFCSISKKNQSKIHLKNVEGGQDICRGNSRTNPCMRFLTAFLNPKVRLFSSIVLHKYC